MNKLNFVPLKEVMNKMGIDESIKPNIEMLEKRKIIWRKISDFSGLDVDINKVTCSKEGYIEYEGFSKLIAYIKEQNFSNNIDFKNPNNLKKFHIAYNCKVLNRARENKDNKYQIVLNKKPKFLIDIFVKKNLIEKDVEKELKVCQFCLDALHYKGYDYNKMAYKIREEFVNNFSFEEFLGEEFDKNEKDFKD